VEDNKTQEKNPEAKESLEKVFLEEGCNKVPKKAKEWATKGYNPVPEGGVVRPANIPINVPPQKTENKK